MATLWNIDKPSAEAVFAVCLWAGERVSLLPVNMRPVSGLLAQGYIGL